MRLLLVEDERALAQLVAARLGREGFVVDAVHSLDEARAALAVARFDLVLLDLSLPDGDGLGLLDELRRERADLPVILLTARDRLTDRVAGLDHGADDYVAKPFAMDELVARVRAVLRRPGTRLSTSLAVGNVTLDTASQAAAVAGRPLALGRRELDLLDVLMRRAGRVVTRQDLESSLYGFDDLAQANAIEAAVSRLRRRLAEAGADIRIHTVRGVGYFLGEGDGGA
ncbi:response regulator [Zavarzinia sp. CC-PAN008]|uniref:response regulator n=1 Tax=Zavarzinia sp. CC-PAN008 TaxID=3243332 RepID=UPI003F74A3C8